jgi:hypothetical protein
MLAMAMAKNELLYSLSETLASDTNVFLFLHISPGASTCQHMPSSRMQAIACVVPRQFHPPVNPPHRMLLRSFSEATSPPEG